MQDQCIYLSCLSTGTGLALLLQAVNVSRTYQVIAEEEFMVLQICTST